MTERLLLIAAALATAAFAATPIPDAPHSVTAPLGPWAEHVLRLFNLFMGVCTAVFVAVLAALAYVLWQRPRANAATPPDLSQVNRPEQRLRRNVAAAVIGSGVLLIALTVASFFTDRALARLPLQDAVHLELTGHQWWWSATYIDGDPDQYVTAANEIHIPVGKPILVKLKSGDVIHSLWLPNIAGKKDLIPGRTAVIQFRADKPGVYRGQCAEFCGFQHALMGLTFVAEPPGQFDAWKRASLANAADPATPQQERGKQLFESVSCAMCHTISGTLAAGKQAPDLTHVASRMTLAAGTLANTPENLAAWIADPQKHKPGANMPATPLSPEDLAAIVAYLGHLK